MGKKSAPKQPDPYAVSAAQTKSNIDTAQAQQKLGMTGQDTPWGSINYVADPSSPSGYRAVTQLTPEQQALFGQSQDLMAQFGGVTGQRFGIGSDMLDRIGDMGAFDLNAARGTEISDIQKTFLDPQWSERATSLEASLLNKGIRPGSAAYETAMRQFGEQRDGSYNKMFLDAYSTANNAALQERQLPYQELAAILNGAQPTPNPQGVNPAAAPTPGVAPTDISGNVNNAYNQQMQQYNSQMGGMYGLGSAALGGWASQGFPGMSALLALSDRRMKTEITKVGTDPRGWGVYRYRYILDDGAESGWQLGYMADEVEETRPDAVVTSETGIKAVDYGALALN